MTPEHHQEQNTDSPGDFVEHMRCMHYKRDGTQVAYHKYKAEKDG